MEIDSEKSLTQISNVDWGEPPASATFMMRERYEMRRKPLAKLSPEELSRLISLNFADDSKILVPFSLDLLEGSAENEDRDKICLLGSLLRLVDYKWLCHMLHLQRLRRYCKEWLYVYQSDYSEAECRDSREEFYRLSAQVLGKENALLLDWLNLEMSLNNLLVQG